MIAARRMAAACQAVRSVLALRTRAAPSARALIRLADDNSFAELYARREALLVRYVADHAHFVVNFAHLLACRSLSAFQVGADCVDRILSRFDGRLAVLRLGIGRTAYRRFLRDAAFCLTRVGRYVDARRLIDREIARDRANCAFRQIRAELCWPHDPEQAIADLERCLSRGRATAGDKLLLQHLRSMSADNARAPDSEAGQPGRLLVQANACLAAGDLRGYCGALNGYFAAQGLAAVLPDQIDTFDFSRLGGTAEGQHGGPLVSVIMSTCNSQSTAAHAIESILAQSHRNLELIVVDDASTDATPELVRQWAARDHRIRLIGNDRNVGTYVSRNRAMAMARGTFVTFHDSDDWAHPQRIAVHVAEMQKRPKVQVSRSNWLRLKPDGEIFFRRWGETFAHANPASLFLRREVIERAGYFDAVRFGADSEYWFRLHRLIGRSGVLSLEHCLGLGRIRDGSLTRSGAGAMDAENFSPVRSSYNYSYLTWHASQAPEALALPERPAQRPFWAPADMLQGDLPKYPPLRPQFSLRFAESAAANTQPNFIFAISLISAKVAQDWGRVQLLLGHTLRSVLNQTDGRFTVIVCGHEKPDLAEMRDQRVLFFESDRKPPANSRYFRDDKGRKRWLIGTIARDLGGGYIFPLDADDLVHKDVVSSCLSDDNRCGYLIDRGYALDFTHRRLAPIPGAWNASYDRVCGSCAAIYFSPDELPRYRDGDDPSLYFNLFESHAYWPNVAEEFGRPFKRLPFAGGVYVVNHAQNLSFSLQRAGVRTRNIVAAIERLALEDGIEILRRDFGWREIGACSAGPTPIAARQDAPRSGAVIS